MLSTFRGCISTRKQEEFTLSCSHLRSSPTTTLITCFDISGQHQVAWYLYRITRNFVTGSITEENLHEDIGKAIPVTAREGP
jgi:hypothetical protein